MYIQAVKNIMKSRGLNRSGLARLACVSRAAVSKWFAHGGDRDWINVETKTVFTLAEATGVTPDFFFRRRADLSIYRTAFLWDGLYPDTESFLMAVLEGRPIALARLVQILGFHQARLIAGRRAVAMFPKFKKYIHPARRKSLEAIWPLYANR